MARKVQRDTRMASKLVPKSASSWPFFVQKNSAFWLYFVSCVRQMVSNIYWTFSSAREALADQTPRANTLVEYFSPAAPMNRKEKEGK